MNKRGFVITPREIIGLAIFLVFGVLVWFVYQGTFNYFSSQGYSDAGMIGIGVAGLLVLLLILKFKLLRFVM